MEKNMRIVFGIWSAQEKISKEILEDCYILTSDNWNDFGLYTNFNVYIFKDKELYGTYSRKILFEEYDDYTFLIKKLENQNSLFLDWSDIKNQLPNFISLGDDYTQLKKLFSNDEIDYILKTLNDVVYLREKDDKNTSLQLIETKEFETSLLRELSARKFFNEGASILYGKLLDTNRFIFNIDYNINDLNYKYNFNFNKSSLPYRINLISGKNGVGKSLSLLAISQYLLNAESKRKFDFKQIDKPDFISNLIVFSYNFNDNYFLHCINESKAIKYNYFGYHQLKKYKDINLELCFDNPHLLETIKFLSDNYNESKLLRHLSDEERKLEFLIDEHKNNKQIGNLNFKDWKQLVDIIYTELTTIIPCKDIGYSKMLKSFINILKKDKINYSKTIKINDFSYLNKAIEFINKAFDCDAIVLESKSKRITYKKDEFLEDISLDIDFSGSDSRIYFLNKNKKLKLSAGQLTFVNLVINLLSSIEKNSLILIDEPENTLHPNLEIDFIKILQSILDEFESFAIISTHSSIITREVPSQYVHTIRVDNDNDIVISHPTINTFGGDISNIVNYVFDDVLVKHKPHEEWFKNEKKKFETFQQFEEKYKCILGYDLMVHYFNNWE